MPQGGGKRKRGDRTYSGDSVNDGSRPSPHRPDALRLAQNSQSNPSQYGRARDSPRGGGRRGGRGGKALNSPSGSYHQRPPSSASNSMPSPSILRAEQLVEDPEPVTSPISTSTQTALDPTAPYWIYEYFTDEVVKSWDNTRKQSIVSKARAAKEIPNLLILQRIYQETLRSGLDGRILVPDAADVISQIVMDADAVLDKKAAEDFLDIVAISHMYEGHHPHLQTILANCGVPLELVRTNLDEKLLESLGLVRSTFGQSAIRHATNILYRMKIHNLLREESEGYSKLVTELFTTSANESPSPETIAATLTRVNAMIGTFNLDVGRVFDVTLDVFANVLVKHYRFFIKFLRASFWWPSSPVPEFQQSSAINLPSLPKWALPDTHGSKILTEDEKDEVKKAKVERDIKFWERLKEVGLKAYFELGYTRAPPDALETVQIMNEEDLAHFRDWVEQTGTLPPSGNKTAAQLLGFKLRFYESPCRDEEDIMPSNLIHLAALLIKIGFISLYDLYPHLWPSDDAMESVKKEKEKEKGDRDKARRPGGGNNALTRAAALPDDTIPIQSRKAADATTSAAANTSDAKENKLTQEAIKSGEKKSDLPEPVDQKIQLLRSLLCIGALPEALYMMGHFPWLLDLVPDLPEYINRILHYSLTHVYEPLQPLKNVDAVREPSQIVDLDQPSSQKGELRLVDQLPRKVLRWAQLDKIDSSEGIDYRFYWEDWADNIPVCNSVNNVFLLCDYLLNLSGLKIGRDPILLAKLTRIGLHSLDVDPSDENHNRWFDLCKRLLVPALSFAESNSGTVTEVWALLRRFPTAKRYDIYMEWFQAPLSRQHSDLEAQFETIKARTRDVLKRISKTNTKTMARSLAKVAVSSPGKVFEVALKQIESYDNLIDVVVESSRYFTDLAYDILTWSIVNALTKTKTRVQQDGMLTSKWLLALGSFSGSIFKRYSVMNPTPVLHYVADKLMKRQSTDLIVLYNLVLSMAGIVGNVTFNDVQTPAMTGGPYLKSLFMQQLGDRRHEPYMKISARRLMKAIVNGKLAGLLLVLICQQRQTCVYNFPQDNAPLKLLGNLFDENHYYLTQYLDLLHTNLAPKDFHSLIPSLSELIGDYGIEPNVAFWIWRPQIVAEIAQYDKTVSSEKTIANDKDNIESNDEPQLAGSKTRQDDDLTDGESRVEGLSADGTRPLEMLNGLEATMLNGSTPLRSQHSESIESTESKSLSHPIVQRVAESVRPVLPPDTFEILSESFYFAFWRLTPYDLHVPAQYKQEVDKLSTMIKDSKNNRSDLSTTAVRAREQQRKNWTESISQLTTENNSHLSAHIKTKTALREEKDTWFGQFTGKPLDLSIAILEYCFIPRIVLSEVDAFFVFKMFKWMHSQGAKNFKTVGVLDCLFNAKRLAPLFFMCTAKEAEYFGRFLNEVLQDLSKWHASAEVFEKEAHGSKKDLSGFFARGSLLKYEDFRSLLAKWHLNLHDALKACFTGGEYMHIRNAMNILKMIESVFPTINHMGESLMKCLSDLSESETRQDLVVPAKMSLSILKMRSKEWIIRQEFSLNKPSLNGTSTPKPEVPKAKTPQPDISTGKGLNAKAPEFIPKSSSIHQVSKAASVGKGDGAEDGEINDTASVNADGTTANAKDAPKPAEGTTAEEKAEPKPAGKLSTKEAKESLPPKKPSPQPKPSEQSAKPAQKPTDLPAIPPKPRPENFRNQSDPAAAGRPSHGLPNRPDPNLHTSRMTAARPNERINDRAPRDTTDSREQSFRRNERPLESSRDQQPERYGGPRAYDRQEKLYQDDRKNRETPWGGESVPSSRSHDARHSQHPRDSHPPPREERSDRSVRDRQYTESRDYRSEADLQGPRSRDTSMAQPRSSAITHQDRATTHQSSQDFDRGHSNIHPERRLEPVRPEPHGHSTQRGSRTSSPSRRDERSSRHDYHGHHDDRFPQDSRRYGDVNGPPRHEVSRYPTGPRTARHGETNPPAHDERPRENPRSSSFASGLEVNNGRPTQDFGRSRHQESQYGRLNQDPPAGPRMLNGTHNAPPRGNRNVSAPQPHVETRSSAQQPQSTTSGAPERQTPVGPAAARGPSTNQTTSNRPPPIATSIPPASVAESPDTAGVHPDRLKAIQQSQSSGLENSSYARKPPTPVDAPAGPRAPQTPQGQDTHLSSRPNPPSMNQNDRGRGDKRFAGINTVLSQTSAPTGPDRGNQGTSIRGRGARSNVSSSPVTTNPPRSAFGMPTEAGPSQRQDLFSNRPPSSNAGQGREEDASHRRGGLRSNDRKPPPRQRDARSMSPRRDAPPTRARDDILPPPAPRADEARDYRGRGGPMPQAPPMVERERRGGPLREPVGPSGPRDRREYDKRDEWGAPDRRERPERRVSGIEDGGSGRKRGRGPEDGYDQGRAMGHDYPKRPRRGG